MSNQYNKYNNSKIYKIWSPQTELIYIGSTTQTLCQRFTDHKKLFNQYKEGITNYTSSFKILEYEDAKIELIEEVNCENKEQLRRSEGELIRQYKDICVNLLIAGRTRKEWQEDNRDYVNKSCREYYENNKSKVLGQKKEYYEEHKEQIAERRTQPYQCICGSIIKYGDKSKHFRTQKHQSYLEYSMFHLLDL
jgi:hypothetical protein